MPKKPSPILGGFSTQRSRNAGDNETINLAVEIVETKDAKVSGYLYLMSGLDLLYTVGTGPIRGMLALNDTLYVVSGSQVFSISANGTRTFLGSVNGSDAPVSMLKNTKQLLILDGSGAWLVPGGYPLTLGTITSGFGYAVGDTIVLRATNGGVQSAYPQIQVTTIANNPVASFSLVNAGTTYNSAANVATTPIQPKQGNGTGLTLNLTTSNGTITTFAGSAAGTGYAVGDTGTINGGGINGWYQVTTIGGGGAVTGARLLNGGSGYSNGIKSTTRGNPFPASVGAGFSVDIAATAGPITGQSIHSGGENYQAGNVGFISGGTGDATFLITTVGGLGNITNFTILSEGAISSPSTEFTQLSTDGEGSGLVLGSPGYGPVLNLIPINLPFEGPVAGVVIDGFGLAVFLNQQVIAQSNQADLSTWPPLSFGVANQSPDNIMSIAALHDQAYVFKNENTEVWANQGTSPFAFGPLASVHMEFGTCAPFSPAKADNDLIWLERNTQGQGQFLKTSAYAPQLISTQALTEQIQKYANIADCIAYARQEGGHTYYVATFPSAGVTWCYDKTASELVGFPIWTKMAEFNNGYFQRHWGNAFTTWSGGLPPINTQDTYQAQSVIITQDTVLRSESALVGLPSSYSTALFSVWLSIPNGPNTGIIFGDQQLGAAPGLQITIQNDGTGAPEITIGAFDASNIPIVEAAYDFATWANWVNVQVSIDTATQVLQVYANTLISNVLVESLLTPSSITWNSTNPIGTIDLLRWELTGVTI